MNPAGGRTGRPLFLTLSEISEPFGRGESGDYNHNYLLLNPDSQMLVLRQGDNLGCSSPLGVIAEIMFSGRLGSVLQSTSLLLIRQPNISDFRTTNMARIKAWLAGNVMPPCQEMQRGGIPCPLSTTDCFSGKNCRVCAHRLRYRSLLQTQTTVEAGYVWLSG